LSSKREVDSLIVSSISPSDDDDDGDHDDDIVYSWFNGIIQADMMGHVDRYGDVKNYHEKMKSSKSMSLLGFELFVNRSISEFLLIKF
jgi:hypothetical protein